mmetsp:Transcript_15191/g.44420  ORF Transcript_15191/g.44420 Transcript_15191/m.44420 type:complete len:273 (-) Transcript_15191:13-831(-)
MPVDAASCCLMLRTFVSAERPMRRLRPAGQTSRTVTGKRARCTEAELLASLPFLSRAVMGSESPNGHQSWRAAMHSALIPQSSRRLPSLRVWPRTVSRCSPAAMPVRPSSFAFTRPTVSEARAWTASLASTGRGESSTQLTASSKTLPRGLRDEPLARDRCRHCPEQMLHRSSVWESSSTAPCQESFICSAGTGTSSASCLFTSRTVSDRVAGTGTFSPVALSSTNRRTGRRDGLGPRERLWAWSSHWRAEAVLALLALGIRAQWASLGQVK